MTSPWTCSLNLLVIFPFLFTVLLDFLGLNFILAHVAMSPSVVRTDLASTWVIVVIVRSSMLPLIGGCLTPDSILGPQASFLAAVMRRFIPMMKRIGEIVKPVRVYWLG
uniref:Uncharacterized protein n=1 Tax=Anguilla anguilla TaxID=7936 RepID=A0A0E9XJG5_ANGAN